MRSAVLYISYGTSSHGKIDAVKQIAQFEEGNLVENERSTE